MFYFARGSTSSRLIGGGQERLGIAASLLLLIRRGHDRTDHVETGYALFTDATSPNDPSALEDHTAGVGRDPQIAQGTGRQPLIDGHLDTHGTHVQCRRVSLDRREDLNLCVRSPACAVAPFVGLQCGSDLGVLAPGRRWIRTLSWELGAHGQPELKSCRDTG